VWLFLLTSFVLDAIGLGVEAYAHLRLHLGPPYAWPILRQGRVPDLTNFAEPIKHLHTREFFSSAFTIPYMYPAPVAPLYGFFLGLPNARNVFEFSLLGILIFVTALFGWQLKRKGLGAWKSALVSVGALALSYPALFELKQGNMELFVCVLVGLGVLCFLKDRLHLAAVFFGVAGAMKIFPFIYFGLFLGRRRYTPLVTGMVTAVLITIGSLLYIYPNLSVSWHGIATNLAYYQRTTALIASPEMPFDHSLFAVFKRLLEHLHHHRMASPSRMALILHAYLLFAAVGGVATFFLRILRLPVANQVLCLCVASILLPPVSFDYTLLHLYVPWAIIVLLALERGARRTPGLLAVMVCFAFAMSIETEVILRGSTLDGPIKALALCALLTLALCYPLANASEAMRDRAVAA
jgi:hypothetical protein